MAIRTLPCREKGACSFGGMGIACMQSLGPCEIPREIYKVGPEEGWMQKTPFPNSWQLASGLIICSLPREYDCVCCSMLSAKNKKNRSFSPFSSRLLPIISSTQGKECLFGVGGLFVMFWEFLENYPSTEPSPEEMMKLKEGHNCWPHLQYAHKISSDYLYLTSHFYFIYSSQSKDDYTNTTDNVQCLFKALFWKHRV